MTKADTYNVQIGATTIADPRVLDRATALAASTGTNLGIKVKAQLAGPSDFLYVIGTLDFWKDVLPFVGVAVAGGALNSGGKALWDRCFKSKVAKQLESLTEQQTMIADAVASLNASLVESGAFSREVSGVRYCLPTTIGGMPFDVGVSIHDPHIDPATAILALNVAGPEIMKIVEEARATTDRSLGYPQVTGELTVGDDGVIYAHIKVNTVAVDKVF